MAATRKEVQRFLRTTPLEEIKEELEIIGQRLEAYRFGNDGFTPKAIFASCVGVGGTYPCYEVVIRVTDGPVVKGFALKKREIADHGWHGQFHITGVSARRTDGRREILARLSKEIFGRVDRLDLTRLTFAGIELHNEPERRAACHTVVFVLDIRGDGLGNLSGEWKTFETQQLDDFSILDHHRKTLRWVVSLKELFEGWDSHLADLR